MGCAGARPARGQGVQQQSGRELGLARTPEGTPGRVCLSVAGDEPAAKQVVLRLVGELGFDSIDAGSLAESWRQQPGTPTYCMDLDRSAVQTALSKPDVAGIARRRQAADEQARPFFEARPPGLSI